MKQRLKKKLAKQKPQTTVTPETPLTRSAKQITVLVQRMYQLNPTDVQPIAEEYLKSDHIDINSNSFLINGVFYYLGDFIKYYHQRKGK